MQHPMHPTMQLVKSSRVSLKDIAATLGLGISTISQALRNAGTVSKETCRRVQETARSMGYRPDPVLASLAQRRFASDSIDDFRPIVLLYCSRGSYGTEDGLDDESLAHARRFGFALAAAHLNRPEGAARLGQQLFHRGVVGIILDQLFGATNLPDLNWNDFAVVSRGRQPMPVPFSCVRWEIFESLCSVYHRVRARGYRRIGWALLRHEPEHPDDRERLAAALHCLNFAGPAERIPILHCPLSPKERVFAETAEWAQHFRPDAVIGFNALVWVGLHQAGLIPQVGFASLHLIPKSQSPEIAGMVGDNATLRNRATELLDTKVRARMRGAEQKVEQLVLPQIWMEGNSLHRMV